MAETSIIRIFSSHRIDVETQTIPCESIVPVRCGAALDTSNRSHLAGDNVGDNISQKRLSFCELTVQYWAWKNVEADYYGLCHYRRFFNFTHIQYPTDAYKNVMEEQICNETIRKFGLTDQDIQQIVKDADIILPEKRDVSTFPGHFKSIEDHFARANFHHVHDLHTAIDILCELYPEYRESAKAYLSGHEGWFCMMYVMRKSLFQAFSEWLFSILFELEKRLDTSDYCEEELRQIGFIAERLLGIFVLHSLRIQPQLRVKELQTVFFQYPLAKPTPTPWSASADKIVPIALSSSDTLSPACGVTIRSILDHASDDRYYDIVVLHHSIAPAHRQALENLALERNNARVRLIDVTARVSAYTLGTTSHILAETYYRFLIQEVLPEYGKVIYLDSDLIVRADLARLFDTDIGDHLLAAVRDAEMAGQMKRIPSVRIYVQNELKLQNPFAYFQAGVMILNTEALRKERTSAEWLQLASAKLYTYMDQDLLNAYCEGRVFFLDMRWNVLTDNRGRRIDSCIRYAPYAIAKAYLDSRRDPFILHYAGDEKPWNSLSCDESLAFWTVAQGTPFTKELLKMLMGEKEQNASFAENRGLTYLDNSFVPNIGLREALFLYIKKMFPKVLPKIRRLIGR